MSLLRNYFFKYQIGTDTQLSFRDSILSVKKFRTSHGETEKERKGNEKGGGGTGSRVMGKRDSPRATMQMEARHFRIASRRNLPGTEWDGTGRYSAEKRKVPEFRKNRPGKFWSGLEGKLGRKRRRVEILVLSRRYKSLAESAQSRTR